MDIVALPPPPYAPVALSEGLGGGAGFAVTAERCSSVGSAEARQLGAGSRDCANVYDTPQPPRSRSLPLVRCRGCCGGGATASSLAVYSFLVVVSVIALAWNARMALSNALETQQLLKEMAASCSGVLGGSGLSRVSSDDLRDDGPAVGLADGVCMISAADMLQEASKVGQETISTTASGARKRRSPYVKVSQPNVLQEEARTLAHLGSDYYPNPAPELSYPHVDRWIDDAHFGSVVTGNMSNTGGGITIGKSGLYFVYSQVGYVLAAKDAGEVSSSTDHKLMRRQVSSRGGLGGSEPNLLARVRKTRCWSSKSNCSMASSYVGAVFRLDEGDVVTVDVDRARYLWYSPEQTFIGAYHLPS